MEQQSIHNRVIKLKVPQNTIFENIMPAHAIKVRNRNRLG